MARGNPNLADARKGRKKKVDDPFYIKVDDVFRISRDKYNIIISKKFVAEDSGNVYEMSYKFYDTFDGVSSQLQVEDISQENIVRFKERVKDFVVKHKVGKIVITYPPSFQFDPKDIVKEGTEEEEEEETSD